MRRPHLAFNFLIGLALAAVGLPLGGCAAGGSPASRRATPAVLPLVPASPALAPAPRPAPALAVPRAPRADGPEAAASARFARLGLPVYCGGGRGREVALTFDDGPGSYTRDTLRLLRATGITGTFFLIGRNAVQRPGLAAADAHLGEVGDHTLTHPLLTALAPPAMATEMNAGLADAQRATNRPVRLFRPPYGALNAAVRARARWMGLPTILWNVDSRDSLGAGTAAVVHNAQAGLKPGAIILMHENTPGTRAGLRLILRAVRRHRLRPVTVGRLLADDPPSLRQLRAGYNGCLVAESRRR